MNPNANLREQLKLAGVDWTGKDSDELTSKEISDLHEAHVRLCELVDSLDQWIRHGGFLPEHWYINRP